MKILIINGSYRKKNTYGLLKRIEPLLGDNEIDFINIKDYDIKPCTGCENCMRKGTCPIKDDAKTLLDKMETADGIIIGSPVHLRQLSGALKVIIDRACSWYHRSPIVGTPIFFVTTTQVTGSKNTLKYLKDLSIQWGTIYSGSVCRTLFNIDKSFKDNEFKLFLRYLNIDNRNQYKPSMKQVMEFNTQKVLAEEILPLDKVYWEEKGYLKKPYFYDCRINIFKRALGFVYYKFLSNIISKNKVE